jgi:nucleoside-diphosphate-sugar epimerase
MPQHRREVTVARAVLPVLPARRVTVYGAFGPLGAATADALHEGRQLTLTDVVSVDEAAQRPPFNRGAPLPHRVAGDHDYGVVDVSDGDAVLRAAEGADVLVNLSVLRRDPTLSFQVNAVGAYNVMVAALRNGIGRVVHTGPEIVSAATHGRYAGGYWANFDIPSRVPPRVGASLYFISKLVGLEICQVFADRTGIQIPALLYGNFRNPQDADDDILDGFPICVSWSDGAAAVRAAVEVEKLPGSLEIMTICADLPQRKVLNREAKELLGWTPRDDFQSFWRRSFDEPDTPRALRVRTPE